MNAPRLDSAERSEDREPSERAAGAEARTAASGPATVEVHAGSASKDLGVVGTCSFSVT